MAKTKAPVVASPTTDDLDDLLGDDSVVGTKPNQTGASASAKAAAETTAETPEAKAARLAAAKEAKDKEKAEKKEAKDKEKAEKKAAKDKEKAEKPARQYKGVMVRFTNQAGETIEGFGQLYYVVRANGKLHYKQADQVSILTEEEIAAAKATV